MYGELFLYIIDLVSYTCVKKNRKFGRSYISFITKSFNKSSQEKKKIVQTQYVNVISTRVNNEKFKVKPRDGMTVVVTGPTKINQ